MNNIYKLLVSSKNVSHLRYDLHSSNLTQINFHSIRYINKSLSFVNYCNHYKIAYVYSSSHSNIQHDEYCLRIFLNYFSILHNKLFQQYYSTIQFS